METREGAKLSAEIEDLTLNRREELVRVAAQAALYPEYIYQPVDHPGMLRCNALENAGLLATSVAGAGIAGRTGWIMTTKGRMVAAALLREIADTVDVSPFARAGVL